jgi:hypothetical protein
MRHNLIFHIKIDMSQVDSPDTKASETSMFSSIVPGTSSSTDSSAPSNTSIFTKVVNKVQYVTSKSLDDPKAAEFAKEKAIQDAQDKAVAERKAAADSIAAKELAKKKETDEKAKTLEDKSKYNVYRAAGNAASGILSVFFSLLLVSLMLYGGHLVANRDIGYNTPFRLLSFFYGTIFFFYHIPKGLYDKYISKKHLEYYTFLPLSTYAPTGDLEKIFFGPFCYTETQTALEARSLVEQMYSTAFQQTQIKSK